MKAKYSVIPFVPAFLVMLYFKLMSIVGADGSVRGRDLALPDESGLHFALPSALLKGAAGLARTMHEEAKRMAAALADEQIEDCKRILRAEIAATARHFDDVKEVLDGIR